MVEVSLIHWSDEEAGGGELTAGDANPTPGVCS
jgi:hypothetical protein